jgi:hypothetical protein
MTAAGADMTAVAADMTADAVDMTADASLMNVTGVTMNAGTVAEATDASGEIGCTEKRPPTRQSLPLP